MIRCGIFDCPVNCLDFQQFNNTEAEQNFAANSDLHQLRVRSLFEKFEWRQEPVTVFCTQAFDV